MTRHLVFSALMASIMPCALANVNRIAAEGDYPIHLQGVCTDGKDIWWAHTTELVRTDADGKVLAHAKGLANHHGDLCVVSGTVYVAVNLGSFNTEDKADSYVYAYNASDLKFIKRWKVPELRHGAGGITHADGRFFVVGGLPPSHKRNYVYEYNGDFSFVDRHVLKSGWTYLGIQTADFSDGRFFFGCYGGRNSVTGEKVPATALVTGADLCGLEKVKEDISLGSLLFKGRRMRAEMEKVTDASGKLRYRVFLVPVENPRLGKR